MSELRVCGPVWLSLKTVGHIMNILRVYDYYMVCCFYENRKFDFIGESRKGARKRTYFLFYLLKVNLQLFEYFFPNFRILEFQITNLCF
jgi:hypothetical protein